jgi:hypothetical protein
MREDFKEVSRQSKAKIQKTPEGKYQVIADVREYEGPFGKATSSLLVASADCFHTAAQIMTQYNSRIPK